MNYKKKPNQNSEDAPVSQETVDKIKLEILESFEKIQASDVVSKVEKALQAAQQAIIKSEEELTKQINKKIKKQSHDKK